MKRTKKKTRRPRKDDRLSTLVGRLRAAILATKKARREDKKSLRLKLAACRASNREQLRRAREQTREQRARFFALKKSTKRFMTALNLRNIFAGPSSNV